MMRLTREATILPETPQFTSALMWSAAAVTALIDAPLLALAAWRISAELFRKLKWYLVGSAFLVYALIWGTFGSVLYWEEVYSAIFPAWFRWLLPLVYGTLFGTLALLFWRLSRLAARRQVVGFCLMGGLFSIVGHTIGASRGLFRVPLLAGTSIPAALTFGVFEFIFYFCCIVGLAAAARWMSKVLFTTPDRK